MKRLTLALLGALVGSCNAPATGLFVVVDVSPLFRNDFGLTRLQLEVFNDAAGSAASQTRSFENPQFPLSFSVLPARLNGTYRLELTGLSSLPRSPAVFIVRRIVTMVEGEVQAISIPVRGHCAGSGLTRCPDVNTTCLVERDQCAPARQPTRPYAQAVDTPCQVPQIRDENFECNSMPTMP